MEIGKPVQAPYTTEPAHDPFQQPARTPHELPDPTPATPVPVEEPVHV